jgi:hypothetical protein
MFFVIQVESPDRLRLIADSYAQMWQRCVCLIAAAQKEHHDNAVELVGVLYWAWLTRNLWVFVRQVFKHQNSHF